MIVLVDYGLGNLASVRNAVHAVGGEVQLTENPDIVAGASGIILPGVGAASAGMQGLRSRGLDGVVREAALRGTPVLGLCLGMQLLFDGSEEGDARCLGLIPGRVRRLRTSEKVPHIGWNQVSLQGKEGGLWHEVAPDPYFYFVHSYVCEPEDTTQAAGWTDYGGTFCSAVAHGAVWGTQFHPERSGRTGLQLIKNFVSLCFVNGLN